MHSSWSTMLEGHNRREWVERAQITHSASMTVSSAPAACGALECKASQWEDGCVRGGIREKGKERSKRALVLQKQAHRCMAVKNIHTSVPPSELPWVTPASPPQKRLPRALTHSCFLKISSFFPCDRSKLLRWNDDHPSWHWSEGGWLHHLSVPQRGLVEACAVLAPGVSQRSGGNIEPLRSWREGHGALSEQGTAHLMTEKDWLAGAQLLWKTEIAGHAEIHGTYCTLRHTHKHTHTLIKVLGRIITSVFHWGQFSPVMSSY